MHIVHLSPYYAPAYAYGGVVRAVEGMTRALVWRGHEVSVLTTDALNHQQRYDGPLRDVVDGVTIHRSANVVNALRARYNLGTPRGLRILAEQVLATADVLHIHEFRTVENLIVTPVAARLNIPIVMSPHGTLVYETGRSRLKALWDRLLSPAVAQRIDHIIALTAQEQADAEALWQDMGRRRIPAQFSVVPNGVDVAEFEALPAGDSFRARYGLGDEVVVLFLGRLHARKGVDVLVRAFQQANIPNAWLVVAGPDEGMHATLQALAGEQVVLTGYLDAEARREALAAADVFALPAMGEGQSIAVLEAMAAGLPVLLSPGCHLPQAAEAGAGLIVKPEVTALAEALVMLLSDVTRREEMGKAAKALIHAQFTWKAVAAQLEDVYAQVTSTP